MIGVSKFKDINWAAVRAEIADELNYRLQRLKYDFQLAGYKFELFCLWLEQHIASVIRPALWRLCIGLFYSALIIAALGVFAYPPRSLITGWDNAYLNRLLVYGHTLRPETTYRLAGMTAFICYLSLGCRFPHLRLRDPISRIIWGYVFGLAAFKRGIIFPLVKGAVSGYALYVAGALASDKLLGLPVKHIVIAGYDLTPYYPAAASITGAYIAVTRRSGRALDNGVISLKEMSRRSGEIVSSTTHLVVLAILLYYALPFTLNYNAHTHKGDTFNLVVVWGLALFDLWVIGYVVHYLHTLWFALRPSMHRIDDADKVEGDARRATPQEAAAAMSGAPRPGPAGQTAAS